MAGTKGLTSPGLDPPRIPRIGGVPNPVAIESPEILRAQATPAPAASPAAEGTSVSFRNEIAAIERQRIAAAMEKAGGNKTEAALALGISVRTLHYKLRKYAI